MRTFIGLGAVLALAAGAQAQVWNEVGDAPARTAINGVPSAAVQITVGVGPITTINGLGQVDTTGQIDADVYCVRVPGQPGTVVPVSIDTLLTNPAWDTMVALYDSTGATQLLFNDDNPFPLSLVTGTVAPGDYQVAITRFGGGIDFNNPGGQGTSPYIMRLSGFEFCQVPAPGALSLLALGGLLGARRRR